MAGAPNAPNAPNAPSILAVNTPSIFRGGEVPPDKLVPGRRYGFKSRLSPENPKYEWAFTGRFVKPTHHYFQDSEGNEICVNLETSSFNNSSGKVPVDKLIIGKEYEVIRNYNEFGDDGNFTGILLEPDFHYFDQVIHDPNSPLAKLIRDGYMNVVHNFPWPVNVSNAIFFEVSKPLTYNQTYRSIMSLPRERGFHNKNMPENTVGLIKGFVEGFTRGPHEFPARPETGQNTTTRNTRNTKKPRPRKNKRKSKKSKKSN